MAKKKNNFYAVKIGISPGIYSSWDECKAQVSGFNGALYKGFVTKHEAEAYLSGESAPVCELGNKAEQDSDAVIYVDGSFDKVTGTYGYGCVILLDGKNVKNLYGAGNNRDTVRLRNVAGEMLAAMYAVRYAIKSNLKSVLICYDYAGIEFWATGKWKTKNDLTAKYANAMREWENDIEIRFQKVTAHTGVKYNELADQLAKFAVSKFNNKTKDETDFGIKTEVNEGYADPDIKAITPKEKEAHIEAVEMAMDWNDTYEPAVSKVDYLLYEQFCQERANSGDKSFYGSP